jgi:hypothetical protein
MDIQLPVLDDAILMVSDVLTNLNRRRVYEFAAMHRLPAIYEFDFLVRDGGLMSYGPDLDESFDRVAALVDRILKGANPAELHSSSRRAFALFSTSGPRKRSASTCRLAAHAGRRGDRMKRCSRPATARSFSAI